MWYNIPEFDILSQNITVPGFSPSFPDAHCTSDGTICHLVTGEAEINAASTISALIYSRTFNLATTYFLIAGVAGVSPKVTTIGSVTFARFAVQVALQYQIDAREIPTDWPTGYVPQGSYSPDQYPGYIYGTEVFELNDALRQRVIDFASNVTLVDSEDAQAVRANYANTSLYGPGADTPSVVACDTATSDVWFSGSLLGETFENTTLLFTNGTAVYCTTQQEENATLESLMRGALSGLVDFSRIIVMRSASDFDRQFEGQSASDNLLGDTPGYDIALTNLYLVGVKVVEGIVEEWEETFEKGVEAENYVGDILGSLGGKPDFGPQSVSGEAVSEKRSFSGRKGRRADRRRHRLNL